MRLGIVCTEARSIRPQSRIRSALSASGSTRCQCQAQPVWTTSWKTTPVITTLSPQSAQEGESAPRPTKRRPRFQVRKIVRPIFILLPRLPAEHPIRGKQPSDLNRIGSRDYDQMDWPPTQPSIRPVQQKILEWVFRRMAS